VNYGLFVGFKEQLGFFEFCYEFFTKICVFWAKHNIFKLDVGDFHDPNFFFVLKRLRRVQICKYGLPSEFRKRSFFPIGHGLYLYIPSIFISHGAPGAKNSLKNKQKKNDQNQN
jgi:hypothetical protein